MYFSLLVKLQRVALGGKLNVSGKSSWVKYHQSINSDWRYYIRTAERSESHHNNAHGHCTIVC